MTRKKLFSQLKGFAHGGDYNPEQWLEYPDILEQDITLMKKASINCVSLGIFSWSFYEPEENLFQFDWMEKIIDRLYENGIYVVLATPSGARPAWLDAKYPEAMRVDSYGVRNHHGNRHNHCMSSEKYRELVRRIDTRIAERFANHPAVLMWHISNEFGGYCYCDKCKERFQSYLRKKFDNRIELLNHAWWTGFWSHRYNSFEQIEPPYSNGETSILALNIEWRRFSTWNATDFMKMEIDTVKPFRPELPVTTNFMMMQVFDDYDYQKMALSLDVISWDSYPLFHNDFESLEDTFLLNAFNHSMFRAMKQDRPFMMMESAPGLVNWAAVNKYRRPGIHELAGIQAVACGSDTVQYFQIRKGRGAFEQYHGAVIDHAGTDTTRIFKEVAGLGQGLNRISEVSGSLHRNKVAVIFDTECRWAIDDAKALSEKNKKYMDTCVGIWKELMKLGVEADVIGKDNDFSSYKAVFAPMLYMVSDELGDRIRQYVKNGGHFWTTYFTGYVDENLLCHLGGFPGAGLTEVFGIISEEIDAFYPSDRNHVHWNADGNCSEVVDYAEYIHATTAEVLGIYTDDYVKDQPAVTVNHYGAGIAYYVACRMEPRDMHRFLEQVCTDAGVPVKKNLDGIEYHVRYGNDCAYEFYLNTGNSDRQLSDLDGIDLKNSQKVSKTMTLKPRAYLILKKGIG